MDSGSLIAFGALCILLLPAILLAVDLTKKKEMEHDDKLTTDNGPEKENYASDPMNSNTKSKNVDADDLSETNLDTKSEVAIPVDSNNAGNKWRCVCESGFVLPGLLQNFSGAESVLRMSAGQCYHKKSV